MSRKSADAQATQVAGTIGTRLPAPVGLSSAESTLWRAVVDSKPAVWFGPDSAPVLAEYVRAVVMCDTLASRLRHVLAGGTIDDVRLVLGLRDKESRRAALLATKLRLTQQSRYTPQSAATADTRATGRRPWDKPA
jgi:hypothetical protein